jgi:aminocarboxymuconate-semialdehyde decarboxylase
MVILMVDQSPNFFTCAHHTADGQPGVVRSARKATSLRIDIHCHCNTPAAAKLVEGLSPPRTDRVRTTPNDLTKRINSDNTRRELPKHTDSALRLADMDRMGIDVQVLSTGPMQFYYWTEPELGRKTSQVINDNLVNVVAKHPDRFVALGTVPLQNTEMAITELDRCVDQLGMRGIEICTNVNGEELASPRLDRFFARVQELDVLLFLHPFSYNESERFNDYNFSNTIGHPLDSALAIGHLIFGGTLERYPGLKLVIAHGGGYLPTYPGRFDHAYRAREDGRQYISAEPSTYLRKLYFDTVVYDPRQVATLVEMYGSDHVLAGTDYPFDMSEKDPIGLIERVQGLSADDAGAIMGRNAARLLGLDEKAWLARLKRAATEGASPP